MPTARWYTPDEVTSAVESYSLVGDRLNDELRRGELTKGSPEWHAMVGPLDQLTRNRLSEPADVVRGIHYDALPGVDPSNLYDLEGDEQDDLGFVSTTAKTSPTGKFRDRPILLRMRLPARLVRLGFRRRT